MPRQTWLQELEAYATELEYIGKTSGHDLCKTLEGSDESAYLEYRKNGAKCDVAVREWTHAERTSKPARRLSTDVDNHQMIQVQGGGAKVSLVQLPTVVIGVNRAGLTKISKEQLR